MNKQQIIIKDEPYLTDGGLETTLLFHEGIELNNFASFELLLNDEGKKILKAYYQKYIDIARSYGVNFILESPTWRSSSNWGNKMGYTKSDLNDINKKAILFMREIAVENNLNRFNTIVSGCVGPAGDGYTIDTKMTAEEAQQYHHDQIQSFAMADPDIVGAITMNYSEEAIGITNASKQTNIPVIISFTLETDGNLPSGESLKQAIALVDKASSNYPLHYMINCAHPEHFMKVLSKDGDWKRRIKGVRANASCKSHEELDNSHSLDIGDMKDLAQNYQQLISVLPELKIFGGCCGTDHRHIQKICEVVF